MKYKFIRFPEGKSKAVTLSYDDGCRADIRLSETISKYGIKATFNIPSHRIAEKEGGWDLTKEEIRKHFLDKGHEIAIHTAHHLANGLQNTADGIKEVLDCRAKLEKDFGIIVRGMAYPDSGIRRFRNGMDYSDVKRYLTDLNIAYARTLGGDNDGFYLPNDWHAWMPTAHHNNSNIFEYIDKFLNINCNKGYQSDLDARLFYLWGHSFEFDNHNNWDRLDEICEKLSGKDDIWYATNGEIYDYVTAYNSLIFSADNSIVHNPSAKTVWFIYGNTPYTIKSGETIKLQNV